MHTPAKHVLLVDDDADVRDAVRRLLESVGHTVECARDGREALSLLALGDRVDVVLLDGQMPVMDGEGFLARRAEDPALRGVPVVLFSGCAALCDRLGRRGDVAATVAKGPDVGAVVAAVARHAR